MKVPECLVKIAPNWSKRFQQAENLRQLDDTAYVGNNYEQRLNIGDVCCCVVGEARCFDGGYAYKNSVDHKNGWCQECFDFSLAFAHNIDPEEYGEPTNKQILDLTMYELMEEFCEHMKVHNGGQ